MEFGLERHLPLHVAVVRIDSEDRAIHQHHQLLEPADVDEEGRRVDIAEIVPAPGDLAVRLLERHQRFPPSAHGHDDRVPEGDGTRGVAVHQVRAPMVGPELLCP